MTIADVHRIARVLLALSLAATLGACATLRSWGAPAPLPPLAPLAPSLPRSATQTLRFAMGDRALILQCALDVAAAGWKTACVSVTGQRLVTLEVDAQGRLRMESDPAIAGALDPARIAADIQLALWPIESLQDAQRGGAWSTQNVSQRTRRLFHEGQLVAEVHYGGIDAWNTTLWVANYRDRYSLEIQTRRHDDPEPTE